MRKRNWIKKGLSALLALNMVLSSVPLPVFAVTEDNLCDHHPVHTAECHYAEGSPGSACTHEHSEDCYAILECLHTCGEECADGCNHECTVDNGCITMELDCRHVHGDCGYSEGTAEVPCGHVHNESCGYVEAVAGNPCANAETDPECDHSGDCGYVAAVEGQPCGHTACDDSCGYAPATEGTPCTHVCEVKVDSDDSCYKLLCSHSSGGHDDACGYVAAVEAHECHYECAECAAALTSEGETDPTTEPTTEPATAPTESAVICTCESDDPSWHAPFCDLYTAPENPECYCVEKCGEGWGNEWCEVCYFDPAACRASGEEEAAVYPSTPTYIASIGIAQDGSSGSTGVNDCKNELSGHTIIDRDLNDGAGGDYVYIGYKTTTDPSKAITGIVFRVGGDPPSSITYNGYTFYLVGGSYETNTASEGGYIDLNGAAGGVYIYMYVTRDSGYGAPLTSMTVDESSSKSGYSTGTNTSGNVIDLNQDAGGDYLYLHYKRFSATVNATYYYLDSSGSRTSNSYSLNVKNHLEALTTKPSCSTSVTYDGRTFTFKGWREDDTAGTATVTSPSVTYITGDKTYRAVYAADVTLSYDANDGSGAPAAQKATQYINAGSSSIAKQSVSFTIPNSTCTHSTKCFIGWSADKAAATAAYQPGGNISISSNTTLYAVYADHSYSSGICDHCGIPVSGSVAVLSKNGKNVFAGTTLDAVITEAENCVESDKAVVTLLQNIDLGNSSLTINSGVFSLDLNGFELKSTYSSGVLSLSGESVNVTLQDSGETGKITATGRAICTDDYATLTIVGGTISSGGYGVYAYGNCEVNISGGTISSNNYGVYAYRKCEVNISGGTINGSNAVYVSNPNSGSGTSGAVVNISGGALNGTKFGVSVNDKTTSGYRVIQVNINGGTINGDTRDIYAYYQYVNHGWVKLNVNASGTGATFPDGLTAKSVCYNDGAGTTLIPMNALLGEGAAYWAGDTMLAPADDATEITDKGDITVKAACTHESGTKQSYANRGDNHTYRWSCCKLEVTEEHTFTDTECVCGAMDHTCQYTNGFCIEGCYEPAQLKDGYYQITNGGNLFWFAEYINTVDRTANAKLTADINLENRPWTPIGSTGESSNNFRGVFDGQNYTITGLYVEGDRAGLGFFGEVRTGTVKNFTIYGNVVVNTEVDYVGGVIGSICGVNGETDLERNGAIIQNITSYVNLTAKAHGVGMIGGFVGYANHQSLIENCSWYGTFDAGIYRVDNGAGGFIGKIQENTSEVTIRNCAAYGTIKTNYAGDYNNTATIYMGGFLSFSNTGAKTTIENCLFAGKFERGANLTDEARLGAFGTLRSVNAIKNCYYLGDDGLAAVHSDSDLKPGSDNVEITSVTGEQLKSGEIAYLLQEANDIWGQTIGTHFAPVLYGETVYAVHNCKNEVTYSNTNENLGHNYVNGVCTVCGASQTVVSVDISWGAMEFTYTDGEWQPESHTYAEGEWTPDADGGNVITVENKGNVAVNASFAYTKTVEAVSGSFTLDGTNPITEVALDVNGKKEIYLLLTGKPNETNGYVTLGTITVTITTGGE